MEREGQSEVQQSIGEGLKKFHDVMDAHGYAVLDTNNLEVTADGVKKLAEHGITANEGDRWSSFTYNDNVSTDHIGPTLRMAINRTTGEIVELGEDSGTSDLGAFGFQGETTVSKEWEQE